MMKTSEFTLIASGLDPRADDFEDRLYEAGCSDATIAFQRGMIIIEFARKADSFAAALVSACADVAKAGATIERIEPDYLVNLSDIAERCGLSRAAVSLYCKGERGSGFPKPAARVTSDSPLWDWVDVSDWLYRQNRVSAEIVTEARLVRQANLIRQCVPQETFVEQLTEKLRNLEPA
jgi:putative intracellular protease/amidase